MRACLGFARGTTTSSSTIETPIVDDDTRLQHWIDGQRKSTRYEMEICMLGAADIGRMSLIVRFMLDHYVEHYFDPSEDYHFRRLVNIADREVMVNIYIIQPPLRVEGYSIKHWLESYHRFYMLVYNVGMRASFEAIEDCIANLLQVRQGAWYAGVILANAVDLPHAEHAADVQAGQRLAQTHNIALQETSAKTEQGCTKDDLQTLIRVLLLQAATRSTQPVVGKKK